MRPRIMVIDDTPELLELFQDLLTDEGYEVVPFADGIQDIVEVERVRPDLIILDYIIRGGRRSAGNCSNNCSCSPPRPPSR